MITLSLCMIVKNEEDVLSCCLNSIKDFVDEIIIVDTGSTDNTKEIAKIYTSKIYDFKWIDNFSAARNYSFSKASKDYILWLDADDILPETEFEKFKQLKTNFPVSFDVINLKYSVEFDEFHNPTFSFYRERIIKNNMNFKWIGPIHEVIDHNSNSIFYDISIYHKKNKINDPLRNINIYKKLIINGYKFTSRDEYYYGRELYYQGSYNEAIVFLDKFIKTNKGWTEDVICACEFIYYCYCELGESKLALTYLYKTFDFSYPRAEIACDIGNHFFDLEEYKEAIEWYKLAASTKINYYNGGFISVDCYGFIPYIQLCFCYYKLGDIDEANNYNEKAGKIKANSSIYLHNKKFLNNLICTNNN